MHIWHLLNARFFYPALINVRYYGAFVLALGFYSSVKCFDFLLKLFFHEHYSYNSHSKKVHHLNKKPLVWRGFLLFLTNKNLYRRSVKIPLCAYFIFQIATIRFLYVLWQISKKHESRHLCVW